MRTEKLENSILSSFEPDLPGFVETEKNWRPTPCRATLRRHTTACGRASMPRVS